MHGEEGAVGVAAGGAVAEVCWEWKSGVGEGEGEVGGVAETCGSEGGCCCCCLFGGV